MRMVTILAASAALLVGCKTVSDVDERPAMAVYQSTKSVPELATCISLALGERGAKMRMERRENGVILPEAIPVAGIPTVLSLVKIEDAAGTRTVTVKAVGKAPSDRSKMDAIYRPCL